MHRDSQKPKTSAAKAVFAGKDIGLEENGSLLSCPRIVHLEF